MHRCRDGAQRRAAVVVETLLCPLPSPQSGEGAGGSYCLVHPPFRFTDSEDTAGYEKQPKKGEKMSRRAVKNRRKPRSDVWAFQTQARLFPALPPLYKADKVHVASSPAEWQRRSSALFVQSNQRSPSSIVSGQLDLWSSSISTGQEFLLLNKYLTVTGEDTFPQGTTRQEVNSGTMAPVFAS